MERIHKWIDRARKDLRLAQNVLAEHDPERAATVAYEAGFRACAGILALAGYRVRSQPGHHRGALEGAARLLPDTVIPALDHLDDARRYRNASLYDDAPPIGESDL